MSENNWIAGAAEALAGGAVLMTTTNKRAPRQTNSEAPFHERPPCRTRASEPHSPSPLERRKPTIQCDGDTEQMRATSLAETYTLPPASPEQGQARSSAKPNDMAPAPTELTGQTPDEHHRIHAGQANSGGQHVGDTQHYTASGNPVIVERWRQRMDFLRARQRIELQAQAICRRYVDGDKVAAAKLWAEVRKKPDHELRVWLQYFIDAMVPLDTAKALIEKELTKLVKDEPIYAWAKGIGGLGEVSLAGIIGECGIGPGDYRTVSALWKRMGMAVISGGRQRKIAGADAIEHGYNAERRSLMWNVGGCVMKAQLRSLKDENGKKIEGSEYSLGELGQVYLDRKAYLRERDPERSAAHVHNDAKRYMEKRLLRQLWQQWRQATCRADTMLLPPAAELIPTERKAA